MPEMLPVVAPHEKVEEAVRNNRNWAKQKSRQPRGLILFIIFSIGLDGEIADPSEQDANTDSGSTSLETGQMRSLTGV
jgi:hypothetical protein